MPKRLSPSSIEELKQLDSVIHTLTNKETGFQQTINEPWKMKNETMKESVGLEKQRKDVQSQKAPINWLPQELLTQIFLVFAKSDIEGSQYPPIILSHVCAKWRIIALATPNLWSRIILRGSKGAEMTQAFLSRSRDAPLELDFAPLPDTLPTAECYQVHDFFDKVSPHFIRCKNLSFQCKIARPIVFIVPFLEDFFNTFPRLQRLELSISTPNPSFIENSSLLQGRVHDKLLQNAPSISTLRHLVIQRVPPLNLPTGLFANLRKLELSYPLKKKSFSPTCYHLTLSTLHDILSSTPLLEELVLSDTVPALPGPSIDSTYDSLPSVKLEYLRSIEWTYPSIFDVPQFLCLLNAPTLDRLDLWVDHSTFKHDEHRIHDYPTRLPAYEYTVPCFPSLRDLSVQCNGDEAMACVLRKFHLPVLENVAFTNADKAVRQTNEKEPLLPVFPRLESIFHDPRLPHLTHLTLSHFKISFETGGGETIFGYMPLLTSLSLDSCVGIGILLRNLQEKTCVGLSNNFEGVSPPGVKFCPRLEALSIRGCHDIDFGCLWELVVTRNGTTKDITREGGSSTGTATVLSNGAKAGSIPLSENKKNWSRVQTERKIKPLKSRQPGLMSTLSLELMTNVVTTLIAMRKVTETANIIYVKVANCRLVTRDQLLSLHDLGVVDVIWANSDLSCARTES